MRNPRTQSFHRFRTFQCAQVKRYKNAIVNENILLRFRRDENGYFWKCISVDGALKSKVLCHQETHPRPPNL